MTLVRADSNNYCQSVTCFVIQLCHVLYSLLKIDLLSVFPLYITIIVIINNNVQYVTNRIK
jgi:hypothetical protein